MRIAMLAGLSLMSATLTAQIVFEPPTSQPLFHRTEGVISADLDEDGHADLITMPRFEGAFLPPRIAVLLGLGDGTFAEPVSTTLSTQSSGRGHVALVNADSHPDLALAFTSNGPSGVSVLYGTGTGGFSGGFTMDITSSAMIDVLPIDLSGDGVMDLLALDQGVLFFVPGKLFALVANGTGGYVLHTGPALELGSQYMATGDVTGDGLVDVLASNFYSGTISLAAGLGGGNFAAAVSVPVGGNPAELLLRDFDGDGELDLAVADPASDRVVVMQGDGEGHFTLVQSLPVSGDPQRISAGPLDADGQLDLLVSNAASSDVTILRGAADGSFSAVTTVSHVPSAGGSALGDFDEDGVVDAAVGTLTTPGEVVVMRNHTYAPGSPFTDLGHALAGIQGYPIQLADGNLLAGMPFGFRLLNGKPLGNASLVLGFSEIDAPFKGGTMVPAVDLLITPLPMNAAGSLALGGTWPSGIPSGFNFYLQFWFKDVGSLHNEAGSNAVRVTTP